jgi:hypothetical protein
MIQITAIFCGTGRAHETSAAQATAFGAGTMSVTIFWAYFVFTAYPTETCIAFTRAFITNTAAAAF